MPTNDPNSTGFQTSSDSGLPEWLSGSDVAGDSTGRLLLTGLPEFDLPEPPKESEVSHGEAVLKPQAGTAPGVATDATTTTPPPAVTPPPNLAGGNDGWQVVQQEVSYNSDDDSPDSRSYRLTVRNSSRIYTHECKLAFPLPPGCKGVRASHAPRRTKVGLEWDLGVLSPDTAVTVSVRLPLTEATQAFVSTPVGVRIATRRCSSYPIVTCEAPTLVPATQTVPLTVVIANAGRGVLKASRIDITTGPDGRVVSQIPCPEVLAHSEHRLEARLPPAPPGPTRWRVVLVSADLPPIHTTVDYTTVLTDLAVSLQVPPRIETDVVGECRIEVTNHEPTPVSGVVVAVTMPEELIFRGATNGGTLTVAGDRIEWVIDALPGAGRWEATASLLGFAPGRVRLVATTATAGAQPATTEAQLDCVVPRSAGGATLAELLAGLSLSAPSLDREKSAPVINEVGERHLVVRSANTRLAIPLHAVRDVLRPLPLAALPGTPSWVRGVANVRGDIVTVVDVAELLDLGEGTGNRGLVIVEGNEGMTLGLLIDEVAGIRPILPDMETPLENRLTRFLAGVGVDANGIVHRLAVADLLAALESELCEPTGADSLPVQAS